jgi:UDP-N-acetyl-2-amino-2-deoxyglucuronate dehydrogenase
MRIETIGIGVIGSGYMGLTYCECVSRNVNGSRLIAIAGGRRAAGLAKEYDVDVEDSAQELFERADVHAVVIATPDQNRLELTEQAAAAGKHVLVEKPMAPTAKDCDAMMAACNKAGVSLGVIQSNRFRKVSRRTKQLIDDGGIGPIQMLRTISAFPLTITKQLFADRKWYLDKSSGGFFMGMAVHNVDFLRWLTGRNATKVFATGNTYSDIDSPNDLSVMAQIEFEGSIMAQMWISSEMPSPCFPNSDIRFEITGRDGTIDCDLYEYLDLGKDDQWDRIFETEKADYWHDLKSPVRLFHHNAVIQDFVDCIREERPPTIGGSEGRAAVEICEACIISARTGMPVTIPKNDSNIGMTRN